MSAILSPHFQVTDYTIEELNMFNIKCNWQFKNQTMEIEGEDNK